MKYTKCDICCRDIEEDKIVLKSVLDKYWKICPRCFKLINQIEKETEKNKKKGILEIFATVYTLINKCPQCGSQRCDSSPEWIEGCRHYQKLLTSLKEEDEYLRRKNNSDSKEK